MFCIGAVTSPSSHYIISHPIPSLLSKPSKEDILATTGPTFCIFPSANSPSLLSGEIQMTEMGTDSFTFYAISDFGYPTNELKETARAMHAYAQDQNNQPPSMILGLGDNFYPYGVSSPDDPAFQEVWSDVFLRVSSLKLYITISMQVYFISEQSSFL